MRIKDFNSFIALVHDAIMCDEGIQKAIRESTADADNRVKRLERESAEHRVSTCTTHGLGRVEQRLERLEKHFQFQDDVIAKIASQVQVREQIPEEGFPVSIGTVVKILLEHLNLHFVIEPRKIRLVKDSGQSCCEARDRRKK